MEKNRELAKMYVKEGEKICKEKGFLKAGRFWYRYYGQGLVQVVTFRAATESVVDYANFVLTGRREAAVLWDVHSLYKRLPWCPYKVKDGYREYLDPCKPASLLSFKPKGMDLSGNLCNMMSMSFLGTAHAAKCMIDYGFDRLDQIQTHKALTELTEEILTIRGFGDGDVIPYLVSGEPEKSIAIINAREQKMQQLLAQAEVVDTKEIFEEYRDRYIRNMRPQFEFRDMLLAKDTAGIVSLLMKNYQTNVEKLARIGIPKPEHPWTEDQLAEQFSW